VNGRLGLLALAAVLFFAGCRASAPISAESATVFAAGDIATCGQNGDEATARLIDQLAPARHAWWVLAIGDLAYPRGRPQDFASCYAPSWGRFFRRTFPVPGNHEYYTRNASGYYGYFGDRAHPPGGYYRIQLSGWALYALNSNCRAIGGCGPGSPQYTWLTARLQNDPATCKLAFFHHPRYSSGVHGDDAALDALWAQLAEAGFALALAGHDHHYERIEAGGPVQFVVGTGGAPLRRVGHRRAGSRTVVDQSHGVLELKLYPGGYRYRFVDTSGKVRDQGEATCPR